MTLKTRENILAVVTGVLLVVLVATFLLSGRGSSSGQLHDTRKNLKADNKQLDAEKEQLGDAASKQLAAWNHRSLPSNLENARELYQNWLRELAAETLSTGVKVGSAGGLSRPGVYTMLSFSVQGRGTPDQLTKFLFEFYSADHLHKIRRLTSTRIKGSPERDLLITIQALSLPGADRRNKLSSEPSNRLALSELEKYRELIVKRKMEGERFLESGGLFAAYVPPRPDVEPGPEEPADEPPEFEHAKHTVVTGITEVVGQRPPQVCLIVRTTGKKFQLYEGETFEIGSTRGTIVKIGRREVEIEINGQRRRVGLGDSLHEGVELAQLPE